MINWYWIILVVSFIITSVGGMLGAGPKHVHGESLEDWTKRYKKRVAIGNCLLLIGFLGFIGTLALFVININ